MNDNTEANDAYKHHEENPTTPEPDTEAEAVPVNRHNGEDKTEMGGASVNDLMAKVN